MAPGLISTLERKTGELQQVAIPLALEFAKLELVIVRELAMVGLVAAKNVVRKQPTGQAKRSWVSRQTDSRKKAAIAATLAAALAATVEQKSKRTGSMTAVVGIATARPAESHGTAPGFYRFPGSKR